MSANLYAGTKSLNLILTTPYDTIRTGDIRDDLTSVKVWYSTTQGFDPALGQGTLAFDGSGLSITIPNLTPNTQYYVRYAFISIIDPTTYTISNELSAIVFDEVTGISGKVVSLEGARGAFIYDTNGFNPVPATSLITATAFNTSGTVFYDFLLEGVSVQNTTSNTYTYTPQANYADMPDKLSVKIREGTNSSTVLAEDFIEFTPIKSGADAVNIYVSNPAHTLFTTSANVSTYTGSGTSISVYEGTTALVVDNSAPYANSSFRVTASGTNIVPSAPSNTDPSVLVYSDHSSMSQTQARITYTIIVKNSLGVERTYVTYQNFSKSIEGTGAIAVSNSNKNITFTGPSTGYTGISFSNGGSVIKASIGTTNLSYNTTGANTFSCTITNSGVTVADGVGTNVGTDGSFTIPAPSAMSTDTAYTDVTVTIRDALNVVNTLVSRITYSLTRIGIAGTNGTSTFVATVYKQQVEDPGSPVATASTYNFATGLLTPPTGWTVLQPSTTTTNTWACEYTFTGIPGSTVTGVGNWSTTRIDAVAGASGANGVSINTVELYQQSATAPALPTDTSYDFTTDTVTGTLGSWTRTMPTSSTTATYMTSCTFTVTAPTTTQTRAVWSAAVVVAQNGDKGDPGTNGTSTFVATVYKQQVADPGSPVATASTYNFATGLLTPPTDWTVLQPSTTTTNTWACEYTFTGAPGSTVTGTGSWSTTRIDAVAGAAGSNGVSINTVELYQQSATAPTLPTGTSYDFSTDTVTGTLGSWTRTMPASSTTPTYMTSCTFTVTAPTTTQTRAVWSAAVVVARNGISAPVVSLTTSSQAFVAAKNTGTVSPTSITVTATTTNITTPTYAWYVDGAVQAGSTAATFSVASYSGASKLVKCIVTDGTISVFDQTTIYSLKESDDSINVVNSNENVTFAGPNSGYSGISFTNGGSVIKVFVGATALNYGTTGANTFSCTILNTGATVAAGTGTGTTFTVPAPSAMSTDTAYTDVTVTVRNAANVTATFTSRITYSLSRLGTPGTNGAAAITANLSNQTHIFPADINGNVTSYANSGTIIRVYEGATELVYDATGTTASTWKITPTYTNITASTITDSGNYATVAAYSAGVAAATDSSSVVYTITGRTAANVAFTLTETQTFTKSKTGANGTSPLIYDIVTSSPVLSKEAVDAATTGTYSSITIQGKKYDGSTTTNYGWITVTANSAAEATTATDTASTAATLAPISTAGKSSYTIKMYNQATVAGATLLDTQVVSVLFKGPIGTPGAAGASAVTAILSNETHVFPAANDGTVSSYTNSGTDIRVYEGATELLYDAVGTSNSTWKVVTTVTVPVNITVGTIALVASTSYVRVAAHSGVAAATDTSLITYTITGKNAAGIDFTLTKTQTFTKAKIGLRGSITTYISGQAAWSDTVANNYFTTNYSGIKVVNDTVTQYNSSFSQTKAWSGVAWNLVTSVFDGNLLVAGTVPVAKLDTTLSSRINLIDAPTTGLVTTVGSLNSAIQTEASTRAGETADLFAQYTVKLDVGGKVSGYGLASTSASSVFAIRSDMFYIAAPSGTTGTPDSTPFLHLNTATVVNGVTRQPGTYISNAIIGDGTIDRAKIGLLAVGDAQIENLNVSKLAAGSLTVGQYIQSPDFATGAGGWKISSDGSAEFNNVTARGNIEATSGTISGATITGCTVQTALTGQRIQIDSQGMLFLTGATSGKYGGGATGFKYGTRKYGNGALVYFNNANRKVPFYVNAEQTVADIHLYNRTADPTGAAEIGDLAVVNGVLKICTAAGTPGTWTAVGSQS